ncbi:hypothetical protein GCM10009547_18290 [Sporichthya brevicatena]|uniref:Uncharacterized protein n=1 Tax=Sporichthya brevicatena TaxID=171442 RepID=A0ABN1GQH8_9ACTN
MSGSHPRYGDFSFQAVVDTYDPKLRDLHPGDLRHGLTLQSQYLYGGLRDSDGKTWMLERKFCGPMTGGLWMMSNESGHIALHPQALNASRGEALRLIEPDRRRWTNHLMHKLAPQFGITSHPMSIELDDEHLVWNEGELFELSGPLQGPGFQHYMPARDEPLFYTTQIYWVTGVIDGKACEGFIGLDHGYFAAGQEWKEYRYFTDLELAWGVFANKLGDGTIEYGVLVKGRQGWSGAATFANGELVAKTDRVGVEFELDSDGFIVDAEYDIDGVRYSMVGAEGGRFTSFAEARWAGYQSQSVIVRCVGDDRPLDSGFCWIEFFPERIRAEGLDTRGRG